MKLGAFGILAMISLSCLGLKAYTATTDSDQLLVQISRVSLDSEYYTKLAKVDDDGYALSYADYSGGALHSFDKDWKLTKENLTYFFRQDKFIPMAIASYGDGLIVAGVLNAPNRQLAVFALNKNGTVRKDFGVEGAAYAQIPDSRLERITGSVNILIQTSQKILVSYKTESKARDFFSDLLVRFDAKGKLDSEFGTEGYLIAEVPPRERYHDGNFAKAMKDGTILSVNTLDPKKHTKSPHLLVQKYTANGKIVDNFGDKGKLFLFHSGLACIALDVLELNNGNILLPCIEDFPSSLVFLNQFDKNGNLYLTFGKEGEVSTQLSFPDLSFCRGKNSCYGVSQRPLFFLDREDSLVVAGFRQKGEPESGTDLFLQIGRNNMNGTLSTTNFVKLTEYGSDWEFGGSIKSIRRLSTDVLELVGTSDHLLWAAKINIP